MLSKGRKKRTINIRVLGILVLTSVLLFTIPIRIYELLYLVDTKLGVFTQKSGWIYGLSGAIIGGGIFFAAVAFSKHIKPLKSFKLQSVTLCVLCMLAAGCFLYEGYAVISEAMQGENGVEWFVAVESICCIFSFAAMVTVAVASLGAKVAKSWEYTYFAVILWVVIRLIKLFVSFTAISNVSENLLELFAYISLSLFLMNFFKLCMGYGEKRSAAWFLLYSFFTGVFCLLITVPRYFLLIQKNQIFSAGLKKPDLIYLVLGLVAVTCACLMLGKKVSVGQKEDQCAMPSETPGESL